MAINGATSRCQRACHQCPLNALASYLFRSPPNAVHHGVAPLLAFTVDVAIQDAPGRLSHTCTRQRRGKHFFFLQCRTSTRHGRSTTGNCKDCVKISLEAKPKQKTTPTQPNKHKHNRKTNTHTKARHRPGNTTREICRLGETR